MSLVALCTSSRIRICPRLLQRVAAAASSTHSAANYLPGGRFAPLTGSKAAAVSLSTSAIAKMPSMPKGILKQGQKEDLKLKNPALLVNAAYIDGEWHKRAPSDSSTFDVFNKATGELIGAVPNCGADETARAIRGASAAFGAFEKPGSWAATTGKQRADLLTALLRELTANAEDLARIIVAENGKSLSEARGEVVYSNSFVEWFAGEALRTYGHTAPAPMPGVVNVVLKQPIGVAGLITPWNFPAAMITRKLAPALAAGCTVVIKAPAETPFSALALAYLCERVGIPKGVVNVLTCTKGEKEAAVGKALCESPYVRKISFTGSTGVGKLLMGQSASTLKKLSFELGGNAPFIVFEDADLDKAVDGAIMCKFRASGQTCVCANRIYVHESIYAEFASRLAAKVDRFKLGHGLEEGVTHGPLVSERGVAKAQEHVERSVAHGAKVLVGGKKGEGLFFEPTVLADVTRDCPMSDEETFGPVAGLYRFSTEEEVIALANDADVGLAGYFFSQDVSRCWRVAQALQVGMVGVQTGLIGQNSVPFGGVKESGFGKEGGRGGIDEYLQEKLIVFGGLQ
ncbi:putative UGA2-succinate semialdehyde dehydrogenase [Tilletiaria anomala UBC 951]|uniref:Succinate-semialdehyde dehydrogenase, mitochondrial n=1 Tax=Tilletiaria anomala (strain ATCC 24038 / CBS 436.72 / UBC 951) TaxID=1037660 RepID=A0A066VFT3_TILAU|nr:putative UGA2-succinate semialdehyde dehydrogenase [Tilletiaria anomala UBC 951]KDN37420.1 putative UGA2-succinate semialdehyde dehydrogenase [Tilletiaria anomala UBC 951]